LIPNQEVIFVKKAILFTVVGALMSGAAIAKDDPNEKAIEARHGEMELRAFYAGPLFGMAKGKIPYDAERAATLANNLQILMKLDKSGFWPKGSDVDSYPEKTTTKKALWETYPEVAEYGKKYKTAVDELAAEAGNGVDALRSKVGALGKSCKGCHDEYRQKD
jgi:cytochrome c556